TTRPPAETEASRKTYRPWFPAAAARWLSKPPAPSSSNGSSTASPVARLFTSTPPGEANVSAAADARVVRRSASVHRSSSASRSGASRPECRSVAGSGSGAPEDTLSYDPLAMAKRSTSATKTLRNAESRGADARLRRAEPRDRIRALVHDPEVRPVGDDVARLVADGHAPRDPPAPGVDPYDFGRAVDRRPDRAAGREDAAARRAELDAPEHLPRRRIDLEQRPVVVARRPERVAPRGHGVHVVVARHLLAGDRVRHRIDGGERPVLVRHPEQAEAQGQRLRLAADRDPRDDVAGRGVEPEDRAGVVGDPEDVPVAEEPGRLPTRAHAPRDLVRRRIDAREPAVRLEAADPERPARAGDPARQAADLDPGRHAASVHARDRAAAVIGRPERSLREGQGDGLASDLDRRRRSQREDGDLAEGASPAFRIDRLDAEQVAAGPQLDVVGRRAR